MILRQEKKKLLRTGKGEQKQTKVIANTIAILLNPICQISGEQIHQWSVSHIGQLTEESITSL